MDRDNGGLALTTALQPSRISPQIFSVGPSRDLSPVYGGLLMGQAVSAAATDVGERQCHSVQATFTRRAQPQDTTYFNVTQDLGGNNFTIRHVNATQSNRGIFSAKVSFRKPRSEFEHQQLQKIPPIPKEIETITQEGQHPRPTPAGIDVRWSRSVVDPSGTMELWMRSIESLGDDPTLHTAALLYASDYPILEAGLSTHGLSWQSTGLFTASLNHSAWFLRPPNFSEWHLFRIDSPAAAGGTALGRATCFDRQGNMVATFVQEAKFDLLTLVNDDKPPHVSNIYPAIYQAWIRCRACRHQHRKCDEQRPACSSCRIRGVECDYQRPLKWTGLRNSETFSQQNPTALCTSTSSSVIECAVSPPVLPLQLEFEVADWLLAHTSERSIDADLDIDPPGLQSRNHPSPIAHHQDDSTVQEQSNSSSAGLQTVNGDLWDDNNDSGIGFSEQPLTKPTETSETTAESSSLDNSETGIITSTVLGNLFSHAFESSNDEITFTYYLNRTSSVLMVDLKSIETHMTYALHLIQHLGYLTQPPRSVLMRTLIYRFAMVDVMLAFIQSRHPQASPDFFMYQNNVDQLIGAEEPSFREMHGCHQRVLSFLAKIAILSAYIAKSGSRPSEIQVKGYDLETEMRHWGRIYYGGMAAESSDPPIGRSRERLNSRADLEVVCECFYWTAHILLLRRVFLDDTKSTRVQLIRKRLFRLMDSLVSGCGPDSSLPFPFYIAACEATVTCDQDWVRKKHGEMLAAYRDPAREVLMTSVERIWAKSEP
ncbi:hypothetical protein FMEXI_12842 [Fusarium mexicanum]|uniref:Zn(2)-C6 fungal-type domain-containing protein n=1 Tax=Fusarium mexicanum TaxID=751941 RepID=A0A8H5MIT9_9HYPO|nr:hypothetical protein FMEXI_12842 [Fusarium mexicanum]